jgi:hypothetical protein
MTSNNVATLEPESDQDIKPEDGSNLDELPATDEVAVRAYEIYLARGSHPGQELDDWLQAERELKENRS